MKFDFTLQQLIAYYRECYELDNKQLEVFDFYSKQITNRLILSSSKILLDKEVVQKVNFDWGNAVSKKLRVYEKELDLYACSYFLKAKVKVLGRNKVASIPVFLTPLSLKFEAPNYSVSQTIKQTIVNPTALKVIQELHPELVEETIDRQLQSIWKIADAKKRLRVLQEKFKGIDYSFFQDSSRFFSEKKLKGAIKTEGLNLLLPAIGLALLKKPTASRGVLAELKDIALENKFYPQLIESLFLGTNYNITAESKETIHVPVNLSIPQQNIIKSAYQNNITLAVGPPGTGKSFTIASIAVDAIANGKSVLIASKNDQALKVIAEKLEKDFFAKENIISGGEKYFVRKLLNKFKDILNGVADDSYYDSLRKEVKAQHKSLRKINAAIHRLEEKIKEKSNDELEVTELLLSEDNWSKKIKLFFKSRTIKNLEELERDISTLAHQIELRKEWMKHLLLCIANLRVAEAIRDTQTREVFKKMVKVIESDSGLEKESLFYSLDFKKVLKAFPIWLVNLKELNQYLPLQDGIFDLVVMDEATQCDIASSIPLLFRGKRAVIVGDPKQLRHVSFLAYDTQQELAIKYGVEKFNSKLLDYRNASILDVVMETITAQNQVHYLDEHYRSMPDIVEFSNEEFYNNSLNIMTFKSKNDLEENIEIQYCSGERKNNGVNQGEIDAIFNKIKHNLSLKEERYSVGIISPFANQVKAIQKQVSTAFKVEELNKIDLLVGTPYHFQGEERDEVHLSFTVDEYTAGNVYTYLNKEDVFNVAITRARKRQYIYLSIDTIPHDSYHLLHRYIRSIKNEELANFKTTNTLDYFLNEVKDWLKELEVTVFVARELAGVTIDLLVERGDQLYAIDLVGYPGVYQATFPIEKYKTLYRMGVEVVVVPFSFWYRKNEACKTFLIDKFKLNR
ncbi:MAG: AAA domain-containing protein [Flavobacteriales bacterium]|jgi:hypothetical protein|nr:AAA domain-containing protein [Flavobacteriales bacterium]